MHNMFGAVVGAGVGALRKKMMRYKDPAFCRPLSAVG